MPNTRFPAKSSFDDLYRSGLGVVSWNGDPHLHGSAATAPTSQLGYAMSVPYRAGQVVTNLGFHVSTAAAGTVPTGIFVGLCNLTTILMDSANKASDTAWTTLGLRQVALSSAYTIPSDGLYYHLFLQNGVFGTTPLQLGRTANVQNQISGGWFFATIGSGLTALPAVAASAGTFTASGQNFTTYST